MIDAYLAAEDFGRIQIDIVCETHLGRGVGRLGSQAGLFKW